MSDRMLPLPSQRWAEVPTAEHVRGYPDLAPVDGSESVLKVVLEFVALVRRNVLLVGGSVVLTLGILGVMLHSEHPVFRASAVIRLADKTRSMAGGLGTSANDQLGGSLTDPILSQLQVLQSRGVAEQIVSKEGLQLRSLTRGFSWAYIDSATVAPDAPLDTIKLQFTDSAVVARIHDRAVRGRYGEPIDNGGVRLTIAKRPPVDAADILVVSAASATDDVLAHLRGRARDRTDIVDVTYEATDPALAQRSVNAAVTAFQALNAQTARAESMRRREFIEQQLAKTQAMLSEAQLAHNAFRTREHVYSSQDKFKAQQTDLTGLEVRRQELDADRQMYVGLLASLDSVPPGANHDERLNALVSAPGIASNAVVAQMFGELLRLRAARDSLTTGTFAAAPSNPDVKRLDALIAGAQANVVTAVRGQISSIDARLAALDALKTKSTKQLATLPTTEAQESDLVAQVQTYQRETERLQDELQKAQIEEAAEAGEVEIVDLATRPTQAIGAGRAPKIIFSLLLGLVLGAIAAYVLENYSAVIRKRDDLERAVQTPNLAVIPKIKGIGARQPRGPIKRLAGRSANGNGHGPTVTDVRDVPPDLVIINDARSNGAEAYRTLRTNLLFSAAVSELKRLVVTSAGPKEGKSTTAANLAIAYAQQGHRVLLVDCDLRRPRIHKMFGQHQQPGLSDLLAGRIALDAAVQQTAVHNLLILPAGTLPPNPVELLGSPRMRDFLHAMTGVDMVVLDTPPLLAASDAAVLGKITDGVIMVVRAGHTQRGAVQESIQQLANVGVRVIGTVLNDPDAEVAKYAPYYQYYYNNYYDYSSTDA